MVENDVELGFRERRRDLVLHHFHLDVIANGIAGGVFESVLAPDIDANTGVKFQRFPARRGFRIAEHDADFFTQLIGKNAGGLGFAQQRGQFAQRLAHQPRLHAHGGHAHFAFELGLRHQRRDGVDDNNVERVGTSQGFTNGQRFFAAVGLRDKQVVEVHSEFLCVGRIQRVFGVNKRRKATGSLCVGDDMEHQRRFAGRFRTENLNHPAARHAADPEGQVKRQRAGGNHVDLGLRTRITQSHDAAFAVGFGDGGNGGFQFPLA